MSPSLEKQKANDKNKNDKNKIQITIESEEEDQSHQESEHEIPGQEMGIENYKGVSIQRYKGLGEMNPDQIKEIAFVETVRKLVQVTDPDKEVTKLVGGSFLKRKLLVDNGILQ